MGAEAEEIHPQGVHIDRGFAQTLGSITMNLDVKRLRSLSDAGDILNDARFIVDQHHADQRNVRA